MLNYFIYYIRMSQYKLVVTRNKNKTKVFFLHMKRKLRFMILSTKVKKFKKT